MLRASWEIRRMQEYHLCEQLSLLRLTTAAICGSDLHMYEGRAPLEPGTIFGHENLGVIEEVGGRGQDDPTRRPRRFALQHRVRFLL